MSDPDEVDNSLDDKDSSCSGVGNGDRDTRKDEEEYSDQSLMACQCWQGVHSVIGSRACPATALRERPK